MKNIQVNNINVLFENIEDTPRSAIYLYFATDKKMPYEGCHVLLGNLLLQGTDKKTAEEIALELENLGIEVTVDSRCDFLKVSILCLNEDIAPALEIVNDFMINANFMTFNKEVYKFKGETLSSLDSPVTKASDRFYREIFKNHRYGSTNTKILETIDDMKVEHVREYYKNLLSGNKVISICADVKDEDAFLNLVTSKLKFMANSANAEIQKEPVQHSEGLIKITKEDAKQAQIFQGWITEGIGSEDCAKLNILNNVLGGAGLSSRLFVELRDKRGLAYTVRSSYKTLRHGAYFALYIGTEPSNIKKSLEGFKTEIERVIKEPPEQEELRGAIENYTGKYKYFYTQTNAQIASSNGWNYINGAGLDYNEKLIEQIKKITQEDIIEVTKKYLLKAPTTVVLAPGEYLNF
ncbi:MAG: insulinase family protein [Candidatus Gastranaerophilales bacterium]|nr:insulinase family protein [Candidatus Gastranaerophilales bacterium]